jgi:hypothetical protein
MARRRISSGTILVLAVLAFGMVVAGGRALMVKLSRSFVPPTTEPATTGISR